jgi:hypothetical protein
MKIHGEGSMAEIFEGDSRFYGKVIKLFPIAGKEQGSK